MNKTLIKNFAIDARVRLIQMAIDNAGLVGVTKDKITEAVQKGADFEIYKTAAGTDYTITGNKIKQRKNLVERINKIGFEQVMEETAYTWFNRIIAIRYMEVNDYLPTRVRVLSSETAGKKEPDIITMAPDNVDLNFSSAEKDLIRNLKSKQKMDEAFQILFIKQCNELNKELPKLFEKTTGGPLDYTELLFNLSFTRTDGVLARLLEIEEEDFKDQVQIIGWMYQYYNTDLKKKIEDDLANKDVKINKFTLPAKTQLFTPDWIVRYMVENSLGRLYAQNQKEIDEKTVAETMGWKYYLPQSEQTEEVQKQLDTIKQEQQKNGAFNLETIKVLDPCMGSGHILVYAFDVLIQMYKNAGYNERDAAQKIMQNNIFGLDIDNRAAQLAYFALMMKGRQYDRRFFERDIEPNVYAIQESNGISDISIKKAVIQPIENSTANYLIKTFHDAKEYGSIINIESKDYEALKNTLITWKQKHDTTLENVLVETDVDDLIPLCQIAKVMSSKFDVVVTNPPYMGINYFSEKLLDFINLSFEDYKHDLYFVFISKCYKYLKPNGLLGMITQRSFMQNYRFEKGRTSLLNNICFDSLLDLGARAFEEISGEVVQACSFIIRKNIERFNSLFIDLRNGMSESEKEKKYLNNDYEKYVCSNLFFEKIKGKAISYWLDMETIEYMNNIKDLNFYVEPRHGLVTGNGNLFMKLWFEISIVNAKLTDYKNSDSSTYKWFPYNKGGLFRRWYGNRLYIVNWENNGNAIKNYKESGKTKSSNYNDGYNFLENITWSDLTTGLFSARYTPQGSLFDTSGPSLFIKNNEIDIFYFIALMNTCVMQKYLNVYKSGLHYTSGTVGRIPCVIATQKEIISNLSKECVNLSKTDWDAFETSWDFKKHPLLPENVDYKEAADNSILISDCYAKWEKDCSDHFTTLKSNEEELNRIFIEIYGLQDELTPEVQDKDVTVRPADKTREIKSFICYAVGCMFGRYSLYKEGLAYAGGNMDMNNYKYFIPDEDNVIPVTDEEYFKDDIVTRFVEFVRQVYGESTLEENLKFISEALGNKGDTPKETIRLYFLNDFYKDHCKIYQKRPIYWMFDSGKENGFKALIYMHRYDNQTLARVRTDYLHKLQTMYEAALVQCQQIAENPATSAREKAYNIKRFSKVTKQLEESRLYDQALGHVASQYIDIDLDDGVNVNYEKFQGVQVAREGQKAIKIDLLGKRG